MLTCRCLSPGKSVPAHLELHLSSTPARLVGTRVRFHHVPPHAGARRTGSTMGDGSRRRRLARQAASCVATQTILPDASRRHPDAALLLVKAMARQDMPDGADHDEPADPVAMSSSAAAALCGMRSLHTGATSLEPNGAIDASPLPSYRRCGVADGPRRSSSPSLLRSCQVERSLPPRATHPSGYVSAPSGREIAVTDGRPYWSTILLPLRSKCSIAATSRRRSPPPTEGWRNWCETKAYQDGRECCRCREGQSRFL